jgi:hypothetical protein
MGKVYRVVPVVSGERDNNNGTVSPDGRWLLYDSGITGQGEVFVESVPHPLFKMPTNAWRGSIARTYDVSRGGQRFLITLPLADATEAPITVIVNWPKLLEKK